MVVRIAFHFLVGAALVAFQTGGLMRGRRERVFDLYRSKQHCTGRSTATLVRRWRRSISAGSMVRC